MSCAFNLQLFAKIYSAQLNSLFKNLVLNRKILLFDRNNKKMAKEKLEFKKNLTVSPAKNNGIA